MANSVVQKAIFPVAGLGTRFLPATKALPKEMLPIVDKPLIQYAVEEAYEAGIRQMIFVTGRSKRAVEDHFDTAYELEVELEKSGKQQLLALVNTVKPADMQCIYVRQARSLGLGHAILCAEPIIGHEPVAVLLADDLMQGSPCVLKQLMDVYAVHQSSVIAVQPVPRAETMHYGIVTGQYIADRVIEIDKMIEKPYPDEAPSTIGIAGRYILTPVVFSKLRMLRAGFGGEIQLTDAIAEVLQDEKVLAYQFEGTRYDCGTKLGFLQATVDVAEKHREVGSLFSSWLQNKETMTEQNDAITKHAAIFTE
ncbi:MAG: UTP--glucose-1-phosphate uridylyltransferase [Legionellales bacterium RIFCSPHIGHO2_12_FULL_37_14]|nr:MAG: UTP--glucose-1-phosphate uridylyltransferase [Legionellales bacterium RIFCSPHIGHO2_12_FULL_37_14]